MSQKKFTSLFIIGLTAWFAPPISELHAQVQKNANYSTHPINPGDVADSGYAKDLNNNRSYCPSDSQDVNDSNDAIPENICHPNTCPTIPCYTNGSGYASDPYPYGDPNDEPQPYYGEPYPYGDPNDEPQPYYGEPYPCDDPNDEPQPYYGEPYPYGDPNDEPRSNYVDYPMYPTEPGYAPGSGYSPYPGHDENPCHYADPYCHDPSYCLGYPQPTPAELSPYSPDFPCSQTNDRCTQKCNLTSGILFGVEGFYWTIFQTNLDYAVDVDTTGSPFSEILGPGKTHFFEYDWRGGGRGYLGFHTCGWEVKGKYTWYENRASGKTTAQLPEMTIAPSLLHPSSQDEIVEESSGHHDLNYQTADFLFGRNLYFCCSSVTLYPFFGARGLRLKQDMRVFYKEEDFLEEDPTRVKWESMLKSIGLHAGLDYYYSYCKNFGLFGSFAGSILVGRTNNHHLQQVVDEENVVQATQIDLKERQYIPIAGYHLSAGIFLAAYDCRDSFMNWRTIFRLKLGYELNEWFQTPQLRRYHNGNQAVSNSATAGSIGLHGGFISAELLF